MAPVLSLRSQPIFIPRPSKVPPTVLTKFISLKVLLELFGGTVCIFVLAVLFWRIGELFRYFTKDKVLRKGNTATTRYAKTWYGWVSLQQHEANKNLFRKFFLKIRQLGFWRSSNTDYHWAWWEPGEGGMKTSPGKRSLRPAQTRAQSNSFTTVSSISNSGPVHPSRSSLVPKLTMRAASSIAMTSAFPVPSAPKLRTVSSQTTRKTNITVLGHANGRSERTIFFTSEQRCFKFRSAPFSDHGSHINCRRGEKFLSLNENLESRFVLSGSLEYRYRPLHSVSLPCLLLPWVYSERVYLNSATTNKADSVGIGHGMVGFIQALRQTRKYQIWSSRMGFRTQKFKEYSTHTLPRAPPGSPRSALLASLSSTNTALGLTGLDRRWGKINGSSCSTSISFLSASECHHIEGNGKEINQVRNLGSARPRIKAPANSAGCPKPKVLSRNQIRCIKGNAKSNKDSEARTLPQCIIPMKQLNKWEIQLIDCLDRKLDWLSNQLSPGRRPFHFALLANHWLNRETWIVYDPVSRVSIDARRRLGDPRFNVPYPKPIPGCKPKYPKTVHRTAHTPKINSWRVAMNRYRRASGLNDFIKGIELYDSSAEDPPDGRVDPASWMIRKPPQGFALSAKQKDAYYEGGTGWQEKLGDWQKVRRGYRIRKAIFEGRVNRTRVKEIAFGISRYYRIVVSKASNCLDTTDI